MGNASQSDELESVVNGRPFLREHLEEDYQEYGEYPEFVGEPNDLTDEYDVRNPNVLYMAGDNTFVHVFGPVGEDIVYYIVEPRLDEEEAETADRIKRRMLQLSSNYVPPKDGEFEEYFDELFDAAMNNSDDDSLVGSIQGLFSEDSLDERSNQRVRYTLNRNISGLGPLHGVMLDSNNEDIHVIGHDQTYIDHGVFGMVKTNVEWEDNEALEAWMENIGERIENPVSDATPIVDSTLPDGSRINIIYSSDISVQGPSMTIRQGVDVPLSILEITKFGTLSPKLAAYLWLCLENERTVFVVGETASGKTTTLNAILTFIPRDSKIYTAEDTAEVLPPHDAWQQLLTREGGGDEQNEIDMFDLVASALRSRPNYIIVGEVRGEEAQMAFQAAQTGHPVCLTFHASDIVSMIQRLTGEPINVPEPFMDNCDVALFQNRVKQGDTVLRRVTSVQEIEGYSKEQDGVITRQVFDWDAQTDDIVFTGMNNSFVLEQKIATLLGYEDVTDIYDELERRSKIIEELIANDMTGYYESNDIFSQIQRDGVESIQGINSTGLIDQGR